HLLHARVRQQRRERRGVIEGQRVDDPCAGGGRHLDEAELLRVAEETVGLGVDGDAPLMEERVLHQRPELIRLLDDGDGSGRRHLSAHQRRRDGVDVMTIALSFLILKSYGDCTPGVCYGATDQPRAAIMTVETPSMFSNT